MHDVMPAEKADPLVAVIRRALSENRVVQHEYSLPIQGNEHWFLASVSRLDDHRVVWVARNITERKRQQREQELQSIVLRGIAEGVCLIRDADAIIVYANPKFEALFGYGAGELLGLPVSILNHDDGRGSSQRAADEILARLRRHGELSYEVQNRRKDGSVFWCRAHTVRLDHPDHGVVWVAIQEDVSERRRTEEALRRNESLLKLVLDTLPVGVWIADEKGKLILVNPEGQRIWGGTRSVDLEKYEEYKGWWADTGVRIDPEESALSRAVNRGETSIDEVIDIESFDGSRKTILNSAVPLRGADRAITGAIIVNQDITDRRRAEQAIREANEKLVLWVEELERRTRQLTQLGQMGELLQSCLSVEEFGHVVADSAPQLFGGTCGAIYLMAASGNLLESIAGWGTGLASDHVFSPDHCWALRRGRVHGRAGGLSLKCRHVKQPVAAPTLCIPMMAQGGTLGVLHLQREPDTVGTGASAEDGWPDPEQTFAGAVAEQIALALANLTLRENLGKQAIRDPLTQLFNRRYMEESFERELRRAQRKGRSISLIFCDLDHFKHFNDTFGHAAGDRMLQELGSYLRRFVRADDIACRYGGEEFVLILPECELDVGTRRAEQMCHDIRGIMVQSRGQSFPALTVSAGVAAFPVHGSTAEELLKAADAALYRAKAEGRDRVVTAPVESPG